MKGERALIAAIGLAAVFVPLNSTMLVVALPAVARDLGTDVASASWLITAYLIAMAALQPVAGRLGDRFGRKRVMLAALAYFALASLGAALADGLVPLVLFRLQQAVAGATLVPNGIGLLREALPAGRRGGAFGLTNVGTGLGASAGPLVGGLLAGIDWRLIFLVNLPLAALALALAWRAVPSRPARSGTRFDLVGALGLAAVLLALAWALTAAGRGALDAPTLALALATVPAALLLARYESRRAYPALPLPLLRVPAFASANAAIALQNFAMYGTMLALPVALAATEDGLAASGLVLAAFSAASIVLAPVGGRLADRFGARVPAVAGAVLLAASLAPLAVTGAALAVPVLAGVLAIGGVGLAFTFPSMRLAAVEAVEERDAGLASGLFSTSRYFGGMASAVAVAVLLGAALPPVGALRGFFALCTAAALGAALASLALGKAVPAGDVLVET